MTSPKRRPCGLSTRTNVLLQSCDDQNEPTLAGRPHRLARHLRGGGLWSRASQKLQNRAAAWILGGEGRFEYWQSRGYHVLPMHFYQPVPDTRELSLSLWEEIHEPVGIDLAVEDQLERLETFRSRFSAEYRRFPISPNPSQPGFWVMNGSFGPGDAEALYCMVRDMNPARIIEVGSGMSTYVIDLALTANRADGAPGCSFTVIDPFASKSVDSIRTVTEMRAERIQDVEIDAFERLESRDILFIDSSHVVATGSDVVFEYLEILPRLRPGVVVHAHDIFIPYEYPRSWLVDRHLFWTEQYILTAFLMLNPSFRVLWAGQYLYRCHLDALLATIPSVAMATPVPYGGPASFWFMRGH